MDEIKVKPIATDFYLVSDFAVGILESAECPMKTQTRLEIVIDEVFGNIVKYSGAESISVSAGVDDGIFTLSFKDNGKPYNPLDVPEPDIEAEFEDRPIGGLGLFIVKKSMDDVFYEYLDGHNILTIKKKI